VIRAGWFTCGRYSAAAARAGMVRAGSAQPHACSDQQRWACEPWQTVQGVRKRRPSRRAATMPAGTDAVATNRHELIWPLPVEHRMGGQQRRPHVRDRGHSAHLQPRGERGNQLPEAPAARAVSLGPRRRGARAAAPHRRRAERAAQRGRRRRRGVRGVRARARQLRIQRRNPGPQALAGRRAGVPAAFLGRVRAGCVWRGCRRDHWRRARRGGRRLERCVRGVVPARACNARRRGCHERRPSSTRAGSRHSRAHAKLLDDATGMLSMRCFQHPHARASGAPMTRAAQCRGAHRASQHMRPPAAPGAP
jgi:hypothetical protein